LIPVKVLVGEDKMTNTALPAWRSIQLLTVPEVAEWARVHPKTVYRWIKIGELEAIQLGARTYRIPESAVVEYLRRNGYGHLIQQVEK
jgi:excisionase family DNA binding protein